jgi:tetratricopeptide (TPR) repeat protein
MYGSLVAAGDKAGAERFAAEWILAHPQDLQFLEYMGLVAFNQKDYARAERRFTEVLAVDPRHGAALNNLAWILAERGAPGAVEAAEKAVALTGNSPAVLDTLAKALASEGKIDRAIEVQKQALAAMPDRHQFRLNLAALHARAGNKEAAAAELETLAKLGNKFPYQAEVAQLQKALPR